MSSIRMFHQVNPEEVEKPLEVFAERMQTWLICPACKQPMEIDLSVNAPQVEMSGSLEFEVYVYATCRTKDCARRGAW